MLSTVNAVLRVQTGFNSADFSLLIRYPAIPPLAGPRASSRSFYKVMLKCFLRAALPPL